MKICVISTDSLRTPPDEYGGIERQAWNIVRGLYMLGHTVHLMAKDGSHKPPNGNLFVIDGNDGIPALADVMVNNFGVEVFVDESHDKVLSVRRPQCPQLSRYEVMSLMGDPRNPVLISKGQRDEKFGGKDWPIVYQSIDLEELPFYDGPRDNHLLYLGQKISEKRIEWACDLAVQTDTPLWIHGPGWGQPECHARINEYVEKYPNLIHNEGEIGGQEKIYKLQHAKALVHLPGALNWCEAGGIVVLEALACGTPCVVSKNGCLPEYIRNGYNGFVVDSVEEAVNALRWISTIRPEDCSASVEKFNYLSQAKQIEGLAYRVLNGERWN